MSPWEHLGGRTHSRKLLGGVGTGAPGGLLHRFHKEGWRNREILQHHRNNVPVLLHVWLHLPHHRLSLQPSRLQSLLPCPQLHHQYVPKHQQQPLLLLSDVLLSAFSPCLGSFSSPSSLLSRWCFYKSSVYRDPGGHVVTGQRGGALRDNGGADKRRHPLQRHSASVRLIRPDLQHSLLCDRHPLQRPAGV